ncbi:MAG: hypothetical protein PHY16_20200 [Methylobacter sp.]|nr:hypothetical protein [Methylobacter sp.]
MSANQKTAEHQRIEEQNKAAVSWENWGPYLSERQWGTVREDYSAQGDAWNYFPHDHARSRAYRWGEDGMAGFCDSKQRFCLSLALWNGQDAILKERLFGLTNHEGNHGEDVKELYYYLDALPSHAYLKMLYKYPQQAYPYSRLVEENRKRDRKQPEFELLDTGLFDSDRYFDVFVEYAKAEADDILMRITAHNRGNADAPLHVIPQLWFRNTWSWGYDDTRPVVSVTETQHEIKVGHHTLGDYYCYCDGAPNLLFTDNDTNTPKLYGHEAKGYFKDAFHEAIVNNQNQAVNPERKGTKAGAHYIFTIPAHAHQVVYLRLTRQSNPQPFTDAEQIFNTRIAETDAFYKAIGGSLVFNTIMHGRINR